MLVNTVSVTDIGYLTIGLENHIRGKFSLYNHSNNFHGDFTRGGPQTSGLGLRYLKKMIIEYWGKMCPCVFAQQTKNLFPFPGGYFSFCKSVWRCIWWNTHCMMVFWCFSACAQWQAVEGENSHTRDPECPRGCMCYHIIPLTPLLHHFHPLFHVSLFLSGLIILYYQLGCLMGLSSLTSYHGSTRSP